MNIKQINNIKIKRVVTHNPYNRKFWCVAPNGKILEEFKDIYKAETWCKETLDFTMRAK